MKLKTRLLLWVGSFFVLIFAISFFWENHIAEANLSQASKKLIGALATENEKKGKSIEAYLLDLLKTTEAQIAALMYEIQMNKAILKGFEPSLKNLEGHTWLNSASILATNKWVDFIECKNEETTTSQILLENNYLSRSLHFPINDEMHLVAVEDEKEPNKWLGPLLGIQLRVGSKHEDFDKKERTYFVFYTPEMLLNYDPLVSRNENLNPSVNILEPFVKWIQIPEEKNYLEVFKQRFLKAQAMLKENPDIIPSEKTWNGLIEKKLKDFPRDNRSYQSCLAFLRGNLDAHKETCTEDHLNSLASQIQMEVEQYRKIGFTWGLSILADSKIFGNQPLDPSFPLGIDNIQGEGGLGQALYTKSVFKKTSAVMTGEAINQKLPFPVQGAPINLNAFSLSGEPSVFLGSSLPMTLNEKETKRNGSLTIGVKGEFLLSSLGKAVSQDALYIYDKKIIAVSDQHGKIQAQSPFYHLDVEKLLENRSGLISLEGNDYYFLKLIPSNKFDLQFFIFKSKKVEFSLIDQVTSGSKALIHKISIRMRLVAISGLIIVLFILTQLAKRITAPISHLARLTKVVEQGNLTKISIPLKDKKDSQDEVYTLYHAFFGMVKGLIEKEKVRGVLNKVVSKEIAEEILKKNINLGGEEKHVTFLFGDIRGFTSLTERMPPTQVTELINCCMTKVSHVIDSYGGVIDKYVGDEVMALFGTPLEKKESALSSIKCALAICDTLKKWNSERKKEGLVPVNMGIGIHSGQAVVGNMGAENRLNYTALGSSVNLASRICSIAGSSEVLISKETLNEEGVLENVEVSELEPISLKGFSDLIVIYKVNGIKVEK